MGANITTLTLLEGEDMGLNVHLPYDKVAHAAGATVPVLNKDDPTCPAAALREHIKFNSIGGADYLFTFISVIGPRGGGADTFISRRRRG